MSPWIRTPLLSAVIFAFVMAPACADESEASPLPDEAGAISDAFPGRSGDDAATLDDAGTDAAPTFHTVEVTNPVLGVDHPDPDVLRVVGADGRATYYLTATVGTGDIDVFTSPDLTTWTKAPNGLFAAGARSVKGKSLAINGREYCSIWAPQLAQLGPSSFLLSFTASRFATAQDGCPAYGENGGTYWATASSPLGPFAPASRTAEPAAFGASPACAIRDSLPRSRDLVTDDCQGGFCHQMVRLDSHVFRDPKTGRAWAAYSWYTNTPPLVQFEKDNYGEHVHIVELDSADPRYVKCDASTAQVFAANAHDDATRAKLAAYCPRCTEKLAFDKGRFDEDFVRDGFSWAVVEGASLVRRGEWVYLFVSGSLFDSAYYTVFFVAAKTVEELSVDNPNRLVGRFLIPSQDQSFGHGSPVLGPDGQSLYFLHHRLQHGPCKATCSCARDVWVSPVDFEDRGDGNGDVWIKPRFPAEDPKFRIAVPD
jgi:beta-xylosidase